MGLAVKRCCVSRAIVDMHVETTVRPPHTGVYMSHHLCLCRMRLRKLKYLAGAHISYRFSVLPSQQAGVGLQIHPLALDRKLSALLGTPGCTTALSQQGASLPPTLFPDGAIIVP